MDKKLIVVVGGGPAGMMAAIRASQLYTGGVTLIEKNSLLGKKLLLSGKGRCNLTNTCDLDSFLRRFSRHGQFLRDAFKKFFYQDLIDFFEESGLKLKIERQLRVFPVCDNADSVLDVLKEKLRANGVKVICGSGLKDIRARNNIIKGLSLSSGEFIPAERIILATGGASYSFTGSTGEVFAIAEKLGHTIVSLKPGLVPLDVSQKYVHVLQGLVLKNIRVKFICTKQEITSEVGELLFTRSGISGALVLSLSSKIVDWLKKGHRVYAEIDLKPALTVQQLDTRLLREFKLNSQRPISRILKNILPLRLIDVFIEVAKINPVKKPAHITKQERESLVSLLKVFRLEVIRSRPLDEAMITRGGISLSEINPRTMESRRVRGLYFAGEMIDVDADTGGFNLQAAFSTGYLAGESAALS